MVKKDAGERKFKYEVVHLGELLVEARATDQSLTGEALVKRALQILYEKGKFVGKVDHKSISYFVLEK